MAYRAASGRMIVWVALVAVLAGIAIGYRTCSKPRGLLDTLDCHYAVIDLNHGRYSVKPALARTDQQETFAQLVQRLKPYAAITGTYYDDRGRPLGDIVVDGKVACRGCQRQGIGFTRSGRIRFLERKGSSKIDWRGCTEGVACGPRLIRNGRIDINVQRDGFGKRASVIEATRCAAGATRDGRLVLLAVREPVTLKRLAEAMRELQAIDAINLDGGALCGFYLEGKSIAEPILPINNVIAVYKRK